MATKPEIAKLMALFEIAFPRFELKPGAPDLYYQILKDIDIEYLDAAARQLVATATFFPAIAEWRQKALDIMTAKNRIPLAAEAWEEVQRQARLVGHRKDPTFTHPLIDRTVKALGWVEICLSEEPDWLYQRFVKAYDAFQKRAEEDVKLLPSVRQLEDRQALGGGDPQNAMNALAKRMRPQ